MQFINRVVEWIFTVLTVLSLGALFGSPIILIAFIATFGWLWGFVYTGFVIVGAIMMLVLVSWLEKEKK